MSTTENADKKEAAAATDGKDDEKNEHGMRTALESLQISDNENTNLESTVSETMVSEDNKSVSRSSDKGKGPATTTGPPGSVHQDKTIVIQGNDAAKQQQPQGVQGASGSRSSSSAGDDPEKQKAEDFRETMLRALDQGNKPMWENQLGWDVMIRCKGASWRVHRSIIVEQSPEWIAKHIPPPGEGTKPTVWVLQSHDKHQLGNVLKFMYYQEYDNAEMDPEKPLEAASIVTNVAMYIAGMSVLCRPMMDYALTFIEDATDIIQDELPKLYKGNIDSLEESIRRGLKIMYEQGNEKYLWSLRVVMAKLMDVCMLYLLLSPGWPTKYVEHWRMLIPLVKRDNEFFREAKMLRPLRGKERTDGQQDGTEDKAEGSA
ncbi:hypothetical protein NKR23_g7391 [Pleurostoma richardsiae]|uniref:BTB domain-containing protein n=1 Tax=Pleurostoma richardsiae TaxID=41990 RepID=A0AA38RLS9_9PEZI|nr:hypothetical protein NKR23_g7391 [Pleurostoma richardsiae]